MRVLTSSMIAAICVTLLAATAASASLSHAAVVARAAAASSPEINVRCDWQSVRVCRNHSCRYHRRPICG
jgi:hypothetical protein